jgi:hypothetical protein
MNACGVEDRRLWRKRHKQGISRKEDGRKEGGRRKRDEEIWERSERMGYKVFLGELSCKATREISFSY